MTKKTKRLIAKYSVCFVFFTFCMYNLVFGIFGQGKLLYNKSLEKEVAKLIKEANALQITVEDLTDKVDFDSAQDWIESQEIKYGYYVEGDKLYLFENESLQNKIEIKEPEIELFTPFPQWLCLIIASGLCVLIVLLIRLSDIKKEAKNDSEQEKPANIGDNSRPVA